LISCMKRGEHMTKHNAKEIGLRIRRQREALGYSRERLAELSEISNSFLSDIERGDRGFSVALLARLARVLGLSADYILFGTEQVTNVNAITDMLSSLDGTITIAKKQDD
jgi:transcriptional regulator with XRE-family HTH domain